MLRKMAKALGVNSLRYLNADDLGPCIQIDGRRICTGCVTGRQPTPAGRKLIEEARNDTSGSTGRTYEKAQKPVTQKRRLLTPAAMNQRSPRQARQEGHV